MRFSDVTRRGCAGVVAGACTALVVCVQVACSSGGPGSSGAVSTGAVASGHTLGPPGATKIDVDQIFPPGPGRELLLNNCTSCHTFVPIVVLQMSKDAWERNKRIHRDRVTALGDSEFATLYEYLIANFNPNRPVPTLPKELLDTWTSY